MISGLAILHDKSVNLDLIAILRRRCPRCRKGPVFHKLVVPNAECPVCHLVFERESGYFTGAMYVSYTLGMVTSTPVWMTLLFMGFSPAIVLGETALQLLITAPLLWSYSRVAWLHLDNLFNPFPPVGSMS